MSRQYDVEQYNTKPHEELLTGFTNYDRLLLELNGRMYYDQYTYYRLLNENGLDAEATYDKILTMLSYLKPYIVFYKHF